MIIYSFLDEIFVNKLGFHFKMKSDIVDWAFFLNTIETYTTKFYALTRVEQTVYIKLFYFTPLKL